MDRSRSKRGYYYDHPDYDSENFSRNKPRYTTANHHYPSSRHHRSGGGGGGIGGGGGGGGRLGKSVDPSMMVTTSYRILCHDMKAGGVIGKSGSIIKAIRQHTGAWINVHELLPGDEERIIEISDTRRRDPEGRMPVFSPAQEALFLIHERILESDSGGGYHFHDRGYGGNDEEVDYGGPRGGGGGGNRVVTRLVVSRMHVGSLLGKGGKIIEHMRIETKTQIRILPRDHTLPRCVSMGEEIVQVVGSVDAVKNAIAKISERLRESQHRDRSHFQGRFHSEDRFFEDDFFPSRRSSGEGFGSRLILGSTGNKSSSYSSRSSGYAYESEGAPNADNSRPFFEDLVFQILCPKDKVESVVGESDGIIDLLQNEIGVDIKVSDPVAGSDEQIIIVSSDEGPDDELFPAQEALLHIQTRIVDLVPEKDNVVTTRLLVPSSDIGCFEEGDGSLSEMKKLTGADIEILPRDKIPAFIPGSHELLQIVGEIKAAREALMEVTARLRSYLYRELFQRDTLQLSDPVPCSLESLSQETASPNKPNGACEGSLSEPLAAASQNAHTPVTGQQSKDLVSGNEISKQNENDRREDPPTAVNRIQVPLVTRSTLEVVIPDYAVPKLLAKNRTKLAQISELSGAKVALVEDDPEGSEKVIRMSGTPDQAERAQSLLQGFILSTQEDGP
ncbi:DNA replication factor C [Ancistrocladus abbreviatus]